MQRTVTGSSPDTPPYLACEAPDSHSIKLKILKIDDVCCSTCGVSKGHFIEIFGDVSDMASSENCFLDV